MAIEFTGYVSSSGAAFGIPVFQKLCVLQSCKVITRKDGRMNFISVTYCLELDVVVFQ